MRAAEGAGRAAPPPGGRPSGPRAGFTLLEVLAALMVTSAFVAVVLPYAGRLATHWWVGETTVEAADGWMQATGRMADDLAQALPYGLGPGGGSGSAFSAGPDAVAFVRPALGGADGLETVTYEVRPSVGGNALVRLSRSFDPEAFGREPGGATATLIDGPYRFRLVVVARDGTRRRAWSPRDGMPSAVELSGVALGDAAGRRRPVPPVPALMPIVARGPAAARPAGGGTP